MELLCHLIAELNNRFDPVSSQHVIELMNLLPSTITSSQHHDFVNVLKMYGDDLLSSKRFHQNYTCGSINGHPKQRLLLPSTHLKNP